MRMVAAKECSINLFKGVDEKHLNENITAFDSRLKDLVIELLTTIPHEEEDTCILPNLSNCKVLGDITTFKPMNAVEIAEMSAMLKQQADSNIGKQGFS